MLLLHRVAVAYTHSLTDGGNSAVTQATNPALVGITATTTGTRVYKITNNKNHKCTPTATINVLHIKVSLASREAVRIFRSLCWTNGH